MVIHNVPLSEGLTRVTYRKVLERLRLQYSHLGPVEVVQQAPSRTYVYVRVSQEAMADSEEPRPDVLDDWLAVLRENSEREERTRGFGFS